MTAGRRIIRGISTKANEGNKEGSEFFFLSLSPFSGSASSGQAHPVEALEEVCGLRIGECRINAHRIHRLRIVHHDCEPGRTPRGFGLRQSSAALNHFQTDPRRQSATA